jgi:hypothetical protein
LFAALPAVICLSVVLVQNMVYNLTSELLYGYTVELLPWEVWNYILYVAMFALLIVPVFTYIAILRYRLYEIDSIWTCIGSVDCFRLRTVRGKESSATNKPHLPAGVSPRSYQAG